MTRSQVYITASIVVGSLSVVGLVYFLAACAYTMPSHASSYAAELQACVHRADSAAESDECAREVRIRYGREAGVP